MVHDHNTMRISSLIGFCSLILMSFLITETSANIELVPSSQTVEEGNTIDLTCTLKMTSSNSCDRPFFSWVFTNQTGVEFEIANASHVHKGPLQENFEARHYPQTNTKGDFKTCIFTLVLLDVTSVLEGQYQCIWGRQESQLTFVSVVPTQESVQPECNLRINNRTQTLQELELVCKANPANPFVDLVWFDQGQQMPSSRSLSGSILTAKSRVPPRNDSASEVEFICQAFNRSGHKLPGSCSIMCQINISVEVAMDYKSDKPLGTFKCPFIMSVGGIRYQRQWLFDGEPVNHQNQSDRFISEGPTGLLHMTEVLPRDNGKTLTCEVTTMFGTYQAETIIQFQEYTKSPSSETDVVSNDFFPIVAVVTVAGLLILFINISVCAVIVKSQIQKRRTASRGNMPPQQQEEGLYATGIVLYDAYGAQVGIDYTPMNQACAGHYDPNEPYQAMTDDKYSRESNYQVPSVNVDGLPIKKQPSVKYMNTMQGASKNRGFHVFSFSRKKSHKSDKDTLSVNASGKDTPAVSPNCYAQPQYGCEASLNTPPNNTQENFYDELH